MGRAKGRCSGTGFGMVRLRVSPAGSAENIESSVMSHFHAMSHVHALQMALIVRSRTKEAGNRWYYTTPDRKVD